MSDGLTVVVVWLLFPGALMFGVLLGRLSLWWERRKLRRLFDRIDRDSCLTHRGKYLSEQDALRRFGGLR